MVFWCHYITGSTRKLGEDDVDDGQDRLKDNDDWGIDGLESVGLKIRF